MNLYKSTLLLFLVIVLLQACSPASGDNTGHEFMPDMQHSIAYEANVTTDYGFNVWETESKVRRKDMSMPRNPVAGTVARGAVGLYNASTAEDKQLLEKSLNGMNGGIAIPQNGSVPFYYDNTEEERTRAIAEIQMNPFPIRDADLKNAKELYNIYCGICHGEKADGNGYLVRDDGGVYPNAPANFLLDDFMTSSPGRYYFSIMYGKNVMGSYADKLSYEERWQVIHYIRSLQAKEKGLAYNELENTFNTFAIPGSQVKDMDVEGEHSEDTDDNSHGDEAHADGDEGAHGSESHNGEEKEHH